MSKRIIIIGCGKSKRATTSCAAADLYIGSLFKSRRAYAESTGAAWFIASAKYGLLLPDDSAATYDLTIEALSPIDLAAWQIGVAQKLVDYLDDDDVPDDIKVEVHAGEDYAAPLARVLEAVGFFINRPTLGMGIGSQRGWLATEMRSRAT